MNCGMQLLDLGAFDGRRLRTVVRGTEGGALVDLYDGEVFICAILFDSLESARRVFGRLMED